jgi:hypothetical protein
VKHDGTTPLPAIKPVAPSALSASKRNADDPEQRKDHGKNPQDVQRESCASKDQYQEQQQNDEHEGSPL